jgi:hypothetical protein
MAGKKITGRTKQLSLKATPQFHQRLKVLAGKENCLMIEVLEEALKLYEEVRKERKKAVKENTTPKVSPKEVAPNTASKHSRDNDGTAEEPNTSSKKRKISE